MHWAVDIKIIRGALYRCHAGDDNGLLKAKQEVCHGTLPDQIVVGTYKISENQIQQVMEEMSECGKYDKIRNNCQIWVVKFLLKLNIPFPGMLKTIAEKMSDYYPTNKYKNYKIMAEMLKQQFSESARENSAEQVEAAM